MRDGDRRRVPAVLVRRVVAVLASASVMAAGCSTDQPDSPRPVVDQIDEALTQVSSRYDEPIVFFEASATLVDARVIVADDYDNGAGIATAYTFRDDTLTGPESLGTANGAVFSADAVSINPDTIFESIDADLGDVLITDFAVTGGPDGTPIYDATVRSDQGGQLRVRLDGEGKVLEVMAS